jgi:Uma2 family endonuclease
MESGAMTDAPWTSNGIEPYDGPPVQLTLPTSVLTLAGFRKWLLSDACPEKGQFCFLGDEVFIDMSPERAGSHNTVKTAITVTLAGLTEQLDIGQYFGDNLPLALEDADTSTMPDAMVIKWESLESGRVRMTPSADGEDSVEVVGAPDLVVEVVSPSSVRKDMVKLPKTYHTLGVPEFWLIDARGPKIIFEIRRWRADGYVTRKGAWQASAVLKRSFKLERKRNRGGFWRYTLLVKE